MGFRTGSYATVWEIKPVRDNVTRLRISTSRKDKETGEYVQDFGGYVSCLGTGCASKAARLSVKDRIKLGDIDVSTSYDKVKDIRYTNFNVFSFDIESENGGGQPGGANDAIDMSFLEVSSDNEDGEEYLPY